MVTAALEEIARGAISLADDDGPLVEEGGCTTTTTMDVFVRMVCASDYQARDPMFHTDKCPLRGYVTLRGVGTEYRTQPCSPLDYAVLRALGRSTTNNKNNNNMDPNLRQAQELELIVMKGDHYKSSSPSSSWWRRWWTRACACVHRSPPGTGGRRVILSFDLAAGEDDREWHEAGKKRSWRSGMTQRKSHLVA